MSQDGISAAHEVFPKIEKKGEGEKKLMNCKRNETHEKLKGSVKELESHVNLFAMKVQNMRQILVLYLAWCGLTQNKHVRRNFVNRFEVVSSEDPNGRPSHYITNENHRHGLKKGQRTRQYSISHDTLERNQGSPF